MSKTSPVPVPGQWLDAFIFFVANLQTGFGPFLSVLLTTSKWTQRDIGLLLSVSGAASLLLQVPMGWLAERVRRPARAAQMAVVGNGLSAAAIATTSALAPILFAKLLHVAASAFLGPAILLITLGSVRREAADARFGRNASFAALGNAIAALGMGVLGHWSSPRVVFVVTAVLALPAALLLVPIDGRLVQTAPARADALPLKRLREIVDRRFAAICVGLLLFQLANAAMLPLAGSDLAIRSQSSATLLIAVCIVAPQLAAAAFAPLVARYASFSLRACFTAGFLALPVRGGILALSPPPGVVVAAQALDGISAVTWCSR